MKKVKKLTALLLAMVFVMSTMLVGCGGGGTAPTASTGEETYNWRFAHEENNGSIQDVYENLV